MRRPMAMLAVVAVLVSCGGEAPDTTPDPPTTDTTTPPPPTTTPTTPTTELTPHLTGDQLLARISMDIRGVRPTLAELDRYRDDPTQLDAMVDEFLHDERFLRHLEDLWAEPIQTRSGRYYVSFVNFGLDAYGHHSEGVMIRSVAEEPLRMLSYLAEHDLPYTQYVLGNWTMADELLGEQWPVDYPEGATGWQKVAYTDERPGVGVLSTNSMWWYRGSMPSNLNRGRANAVSSIFLCDDYLDREVPFVTSEALSSEDAVGDAIKTNPGCIACHASLDPLASHFFGFWFYEGDKVTPEVMSVYHPEREGLWWETTGAEPAFFNVPTGGFEHLGEFIVNDPRYPRCFAKRMWEYTTRTDVDDLAFDIDPLVDAFSASDYNIRELFRTLVRQPAYQGMDDRFSIKLITPELMSSVVTDLTGYAWLEEGRDLVASSEGFAVLAGVADGELAPVAPTTSNISSLLVHERLAENAARAVTQADMAAEPSARRLFMPELTFEETVGGDGEDRIVTQLELLARRMHARTLEDGDPQLESLLRLWADAYAMDPDPSNAWSTVVTAMLRDPNMVLY